MPDKVSIVAVNFNGKDQTIKLVNSIRKLKFPQNSIEVIIVDNNSRDNSVNLIKSKFPNISLIENKKNIGYGPAVNIAAKKAKGKYIFILNNDIILTPNCLRELLQTFKINPNIIVGPKLVSFGKNKSSQVQHFNYWTGNVNMSAKKAKKLTKTEWVQGCAMLTTKKILKSLDYFDEGFAKIYFEDQDLCKRAQKRGVELLINPKAIAYHRQSYSIDKMAKPERLFYWYKNKIRLIAKHGNPLQIISVTLITLASSLYWQLVKRQPTLGSFSRGLIWNLNNPPKRLKSRFF